MRCIRFSVTVVIGKMFYLIKRIPLRERGNPEGPCIYVFFPPEAGKIRPYTLSGNEKCTN